MEPDTSNIQKTIQDSYTSLRDPNPTRSQDSRIRVSPCELGGKPSQSEIDLYSNSIDKPHRRISHRVQNMENNSEKVAAYSPEITGRPLYGSVKVDLYMALLK